MAIAFAPYGKFNLVTNVVSNLVMVIAAKNDFVFMKIPVDRIPTDIAVTGNGKFGYMTNQGATTIAVIDIKIFNIFDHIEVSDNPVTICLID